MGGRWDPPVPPRCSLRCSPLHNAGGRGAPGDGGRGRTGVRLPPCNGGGVYPHGGQASIPPLPLPPGPGSNFTGTLCKAGPGGLGGYSVSRLGEALSGHFVGLGGISRVGNNVPGSPGPLLCCLFISLPGGGGHGWGPRGFCHRVGVGTPLGPAGDRGRIQHRSTRLGQPGLSPSPG